jgi:hypothetical protein
MRERQKLESSLLSGRGLENALGDALALIDLAEGESDTAMIAEAEKAIQDIHRRSEQQRLQLQIDMAKVR